jgi:hypothetical protein
MSTLKLVSSSRILDLLTNAVFVNMRLTPVRGVWEAIESGDGQIVHERKTYRIKRQSASISKFFIQREGLRQGQQIPADVHLQI